MNKSLSKLYNLNKLLQLRSAANSLSSANKLISTTSVNNRNALSRWFSRDDDYFGNANTLMRSLEREFDNVRKQMEKNLFDVDRSFLRLPALSAIDKTKEDFIIVDKEGNRRFQMQFDLKGFEPEEIQVKTEGHNLIVSAKKEQKTSTDYFLREFSQSYMLPEDLKIEDLQSKWTESVLSIEASLPKLPEGEAAAAKPKEIPIKIQHHGELPKGGEKKEKASQK